MHPRLLALPGPQYSYDFSRGLPINGDLIRIFEEGGQGRGTGWAVWDGAVAAAKHLEATSAADPSWLASLRPQSVIEVGAGCGLAGLAAAALLRLPTTLTDLPEVLPSLRRNVAANPSLAPLVRVAPCDWTSPADAAALGPPAGLVIAADVVWLEELVAPLVGALEAVTAPAGRVLLAYQSRSARVDAALWAALGRRFVAEPAAAAAAGEPPRGAQQLFWLRRREGAA